MYFIGSGSLLNQAVNYCLRRGLAVDGVCCPPSDLGCKRIQKKGVHVLESLNPNFNRGLIERKSSDGVVFSINNKHILNDDILSSGLRFYNVHNGLVQQYRGIAEVCIFAALCLGNTKYGVTLQRLLPSQDVDTGPVVSQLSFVIKKEDVFSTVFEKSLKLCHEIFEQNVQATLADTAKTEIIDTAIAVYGFADVVRLGSATTQERLERASALGHYSVFLPKLQEQINSIHLKRMQNPHF